MVDYSEAKKNEETVLKSMQDGALIDPPRSPASPVYPYNKSEESESGHFREFDDTPGVERVTEYHRSGTGYETQPDGTQVQHHSNDRYSVVMGSDYLIVTGQVQIVVHGDCGIKSSGTMNINAADDLAIVAGSNLDLHVGGDLNFNVGGQMSTNVSGDSAETIQGFKSSETTGDVIHSGASMNIIAEDTDLNMVSHGNVNTLAVKGIATRSGANTSVNSKGDTTILSGGTAKIHSGGDMGVSSGGSAQFEGVSSTHISASGGDLHLKGNAIQTSPMVKVAEVALSALQAPLGSAGTPQANATGGDNGAKDSYDGKKEEVEEQRVKDDSQGFFPIDTEKSQRHQMKDGGYKDGIKKTTEYDPDNEE